MQEFTAESQRPQRHDVPGSEKKRDTESHRGDTEMHRGATDGVN